MPTTATTSKTNAALQSCNHGRRYRGGAMSGVSSTSGRWAARCSATHRSHCASRPPSPAHQESSTQTPIPLAASPEFLIGVGYRGIPHVRCGDRVAWKNGGGVIVGFGGGGAWLQVLADEGWRGYVHPAECTFPPI